MFRKILHRKAGRTPAENILRSSAGVKQNAPPTLWVRVHLRRLAAGADNRIRTGDLVLTKDVLCLLSHISVPVFLSFIGTASIL